MKQDEALKLALEALESSDKLINGSGNHFGLEGAMDGYYSGCFDVDGNNKLLNEAIAAIKEALAQPDTQVYKKPWVGLIDDEVYKIAFTLEGEHWKKIADAIEAKLKAKNT